MKFRILHRRIALALLPLLAVSALTGMTYRIGRNWFGMSGDTGLVVRSIHAGGYLGETLSPLYVLFTGGGLLALLASGVIMWRRSDLRIRGGPRWTFRRVHRAASLLLALPIAATATTGIAFRLTQSWLGWSKERAQWLMDIHQGTLLLGRDHRVYYAIAVGLGLLLLLGTGLKMLRLFGRRRAEN